MRNISCCTVFLLLLFSGAIATGQSPLKTRDSSIRGPQTFAMILGISKYKYVRPLAYADKDAELFRDYLKSPGGGSIKSENIFCLLNEQARNAIFWGKGFQWLKAKNLQRGDRLFIYLAGHGDAIDEDQFFFLGYDCNPGGDKNNYLVGGAIQLYNLKKKIATETGQGIEVFFIMDACRSNELPGGLQGQNFLNSAISEKQAGEMIMLATGAGEESLEDASIGTGHGLFTYYLVDGLTGTADSIGIPDHKITFQEIETYVDKNVPAVAEQRFKRKQDPFFCCNENSEKIVSIVDTAYLQKWLRTKKLQHRGPGNAFTEQSDNNPTTGLADTTLIQTYNLFNKAVSNNNLTGKASAEYYYEMMDKKYAGSPYTLDAKSTLAVQFVDLAQDKVNLYLDCQDALTPLQKQELFESGVRLEKAINILKVDDPDFASSLLGRMYFLKASGDFGNSGKNGDLSLAFQYAFAAYKLDPGAAYINNRLATLHLANNRPDSAVYYARKATLAAPNWKCAFTTLALAQNALPSTPTVSPDTTKKVKRPTSKKIQWGLALGGGISKPSITSEPVSANDTLRITGSRGRVKFDLGIIGQIGLGNRVSVRPAVLFSSEQSDIDFDRRSVTGGLIAETIALKTSSISVPIPFIFRFSGKNVTPFFSAGPVFSFLMQKKDINADRVPIKSFDLLGDLGFGVDIGSQKAGLIVSPELKYSRGIIDTHNSNNSGYSNVIAKLNRQAFTFSIYIRKR